MIRATLDEAVPLQVQAGGGETNLYGRVKVYDSAGSLVNTLSLSHIDNGLYGVSHTFTTAGHYTVVYQLFQDAGFVTPADYDIEAEAVEANSDKTNILRILGLTHDNVLIDDHQYDLDGNLLRSRIRHYSSKAEAEAGGTGGLLNTWTVTATYSGERLSSYTVVRE
jgi:hypothetical protein